MLRTPAKRFFVWIWNEKKKPTEQKMPTTSRVNVWTAPFKHSKKYALISKNSWEFFFALCSLSAFYWKYGRKLFGVTRSVRMNHRSNVQSALISEWLDTFCGAQLHTVQQWVGVCTGPESNWDTLSYCQWKNIVIAIKPKPVCNTISCFFPFCPFHSICRFRLSPF